MADSFHSELPEDSADVEMAESSTAAEPETAAAGTAADDDLPFAEGGHNDAPAPRPRISFAQYLGTPVVTLVVGSGEEETLLTAHQGLLVQSPYFEMACAEFADDGSVRLCFCASVCC